MTAEKRSVSAVLATYQGAAFVETQIRSILEQTHPVSEIIVSDDASTDDTLDRLDQALSGAGIASTIVCNDKNIGFVANFERALRASAGDVVILSDQDDSWLPDRVACSMAALEPSRSMVFGDALIDGEPGSTMWQRLDFDERARRRFARDPFSFLMRGNVVMGASIAFTRDLLELALPIPDVAFHDYWLASIAAAAGSLRPLDAAVLNYRQHDQSASGGAPAASATDRARGRLSQTGYLDRQVHLQELSARLRASEPTSAQIAERGASFLEFRGNLPPNRPRRSRSVLAHLIKGDYHLFSRGLTNATYDLIR